MCFAGRPIVVNSSITNYSWVPEFSNHYQPEPLMGNELSFLGPFSFIEPLNKIVFTFNCIFHSIGNTMTFDCIGEN
ncbi:MAG: hypothetical protein AAB724_00925, partial [Patescibacteria group bacterium]